MVFTWLIVHIGFVLFWDIIEAKYISRRVVEDVVEVVVLVVVAFVVIMFACSIFIYLYIKAT